MREYLFRGKRVDNGEWVYGFLCLKNIIKIIRKCFDWRGDYVCDSVEEHKVDSETVGQYTGLTDKNGKKIFEGDIIKICSSNWWCGYTNNQLEKARCRVYYNEKTACFNFNDGKFNFSFDKYLYNDSEKRYSLEVIGNIIDNKELLGE